MRAHWIACVAGALLIAFAAAARSAAREIASPLEGLAKLTSLSPNPQRAGDAEPEAMAGEFVVSEEAPPIEGDESAPTLEGGAIGTMINDDTYTEARQSMDLLEEDLLASFPFTGDQAAKDQAESQRIMTEYWRKWRLDSIQALPEELRADSDHRRAIHDHFMTAIRGLLGPALAAQLEEDIDISIINRPPVGGYDISGVGFTDIDERADALPVSARVETYYLREVIK